MGAAKGSLANAVGSMYVQKYFKEDAKQAALEMVADIRREFDTILDEIDWMDANTKARLVPQKEEHAYIRNLGAGLIT